MARIEIITHQFDHFLSRDPQVKGYDSRYLIWLTLHELLKRNHTLAVTAGISGKKPQGDIAILHVDNTFISAEYADYASQFPVCLNGRVTDISKRAISSAALRRGDDWSGKVMVKSNLNYHAFPELFANKRALEAGASLPFPNIRQSFNNYPLYDSIHQLSAEIWDDPRLAVEKFIPEIEPDGYAVRVYTFFGDVERCTKYVAGEHVVKSANHIRKEPVEIPEAIREIRRKMGFDYGKFEFVIHDGIVSLLDANKTPARPPVLTEAILKGAASFADEFEKRYGLV